MSGIRTSHLEGCWCQKMKIKLKNVSKKYGDFEALKNISLEFEEGKFYGLLGPNGAGKTTLFNSLIRSFPITSGEIIWESESTQVNLKNLYNFIGVVFQDSKLDERLTVKENLLCRGAMYGLTNHDVSKKIDEFDCYLSISSIIHKRYGNLSGGQKRKVDIARALIHSPSLLLLDEPTTGLDPKSRNDLWEAISKLNKEQGLTVILITHYLDEMKDCDALNVLIGGSLYYSGTVDKFIKDNSSTDLVIELKPQVKFEELDLSVYKQKSTPLSLNKVIVKNLSVDSILEILSKNQSKNIIEKFYIDYSNLETAYLNLLKEEAEDVYERTN